MSRTTDPAGLRRSLRLPSLRLPSRGVRSYQGLWPPLALAASACVTAAALGPVDPDAASRRRARPAGTVGVPYAHAGPAHAGPAQAGPAQAGPGPAAAPRTGQAARRPGATSVLPVSVVPGSAVSVGTPHSPAWAGRASPPGAIDCAKDRCIALTFDDGPVAGTARLLRILAAHRARATFFVLGSNVGRYPDVVRRAVAAGHEIGNHSDTHPDLRAMSGGAIRAQLSRTDAAVKRAAGVTPTLLRPPYGATNARVASVARDERLPLILWSADTFDWRDRDPKVIERRAVAGARSGGIVLMHDIHPTTIVAVPRILARLAARGFVFVTVSELFRGGTAPRPGATYRERTRSVGRSDRTAP